MKMSKRDLTPNFTRIAKWRGEIKIGMLISNDVIYVKPVKADLLFMLRGSNDAAISTFENDGVLYVTNGD